LFLINPYKISFIYESSFKKITKTLSLMAFLCVPSSYASHLDDEMSDSQKGAYYDAAANSLTTPYGENNLKISQSPFHENLSFSSEYKGIVNCSTFKTPGPYVPPRFYYFDEMIEEWKNNNDHIPRFPGYISPKITLESPNIVDKSAIYYSTQFININCDQYQSDMTMIYIEGDYYIRPKTFHNTKFNHIKVEPHLYEYINSKGVKKVSHAFAFRGYLNFEENNLDMTFINAKVTVKFND
jgi:hypothetical protein